MFHILQMWNPFSHVELFFICKPFCTIVDDDNSLLARVALLSGEDRSIMLSICSFIYINGGKLAFQMSLQLSLLLFFQPILHNIQGDEATVCVHACTRVYPHPSATKKHDQNRPDRKREKAHYYIQHDEGLHALFCTHFHSEDGLLMGSRS